MPLNLFQPAYQVDFSQPIYFLRRAYKSALSARLCVREVFAQCEVQIDFRASEAQNYVERCRIRFVPDAVKSNMPPEKIIKLAEIIKPNGGRAMLVGGCAR